MSDIRVIPPLEDALTASREEALNGLANTNPKFPPLDVLPCANVQVDNYAVCEKPGRLVCSSCRLVSYCSKCQRAHWPTHKSDCRDPIRSTSWEPGWLVQGREPHFIDRSNLSPTEEFVRKYQEKLSLGTSLWGNVPAMDIVNLPNNEKDPRRDLSLVFAASGDLRNIVTTINALGPDYTGQLNVILNDLSPHVASRNITLLLILGMIPDEVIAADIALHFWYSVFMPMEYRLRILSIVSAILKKGNPAVSPEVHRLLVENVGPVISPDQAQIEYKRVRKAPSRADFRDRMYMGLKPSHRLAFLEYRRFGIVLPFGALNAHFNVPNPSLFFNGVWLQTDYADPLESWDMDKVFAAGKVHGAQPEDVYGCLYFFLSDQLRTFARYIRQHRTSFHVFSFEACALAQGIAQGKLVDLGIPSTIRFDRIDVSNIMDPNYVGIRTVMDAWGGLLAKTDHATLTGYFMNWVAFAERSSVTGAGPSVLKNTVKMMMDSKRIQQDVDPRLATYLVMNGIDTFFDTSDAFAKFWRDHGGNNVELQPRTTHKVIPHRLKTAIDAKPDALPEFADDETWYRYTRLTNWTWTERFVELGHKGV